MSTKLAVLFLTDYIRKRVDSGSLTGALYIDFSKPLDTLSHSLLLGKLPSYGITEVNWAGLRITSFYESGLTGQFQMHTQSMQESPKDQYWAHYCSFFILTI